MTMKQTEEITLGTGERALRVEVTQLAASKALLLLNRIAAALAPALAKAAGDSVGGALGAGKVNTAALLELDVAKLAAGVADGVGELFERLKPEDLQVILLELLSTARVVVCDGKGERIVDLVKKSGAGYGPFDEVFRGRLLDLFRLAYFALELNYSDFYEGLADLKKRAARAAASPKTPTAPSSAGSGT